MLRTLFGRLSAALIGLSLVLSAALALVLQSSHRSFHLESEQRLHQGLAARFAAAGKGEAGLHTIFEQIRDLRLLNPALAAYTVDADGTVLNASIAQDELQRKQVAVGPILEFIRGPAAWPVLGDDPAAKQSKAVFSAAFIGSAADRRFLYVVLGRVKEDGSLFAPTERSYSLREALALTTANVFVALVAALVAVGFITRPLRRLGKVMEAFDASRFNGKARYGEPRSRGTRDEIGRLGKIFDSMADRITLQMESLRRADDARRALYANISHDLETPLTALHGYAETLLMRESVLSAEERKRYLTIVRRQAEQLRELIGQVADLARLELPEFELQKQEMDLGELLEQIVEDLRPLLDEKRLKARFHADTPDVGIFGDAGLLRRAFANVLVNAVQAAPPLTEIGIRIADRAPEAVAVTVTDAGPGLSTEDMRRMFEPHYRGSRHPRPGSPGMGLGLAIARKVLELHGGAILADNAAGGGAQFTLTLNKDGQRAALA